jgi:hypothetical protein
MIVVINQILEVQLNGNHLIIYLKKLSFGLFYRTFEEQFRQVN